jgi:hypothetical protein
MVDTGFFNYNLLSGPFTKILTQFRLGLCSLQNELFTYNLIENPFCQFCLDQVESIEHFMLDCPKFMAPRNFYFEKLKLYIPDFDLYSRKTLIDICLKGHPDLDFDSNFNILLTTSRYIEQSNRFALS